MCVRKTIVKYVIHWENPSQKGMVCPNCKSFAWCDVISSIYEVEGGQDQQWIQHSDVSSVTQIL